jgi:hypothetical protein
MEMIPFFLSPIPRDFIKSYNFLLLQNEMTFEVGPWQCFGTELLNQLDLLIDMVEQQQSSVISTGGINPLMATNITTIKTVTSAASVIDRIDNTIINGSNRTSHGVLPGIPGQ